MPAVCCLCFWMCLGVCACVPDIVNTFHIIPVLCILVHYNDISHVYFKWGPSHKPSFSWGPKTTHVVIQNSCKCILTVNNV